MTVLPPSSPVAASTASTMTAQERRASAGLSLIFALRMLGLFLVVPVFALEARHYTGATPASMGMALGAYGLTQALLQLPLGMASDRFGRKRLVTLGLLVFAAGCAVAALSTSITGLLAGRALQGAGAISAAVTALLADQTRNAVRTKAMAMVGASIGLVFALALVLSPLLAAWVGLSGMFWLMGALALLGIGALYTLVPPEPVRPQGAAVGGSLLAVLRHPALWRINLGVFVLHAVQLGMWLVVPFALVQAGLADKSQHWRLYLPVIVGSLLVMGGGLFRMERKGKLRAAFLTSIVLAGSVQLVLCWQTAHASTGSAPTLWGMGVLLLVFFTGFNTLEAILPSMVSRTAPADARGMALGVYNTVQSLGLFAGGAAGGLLMGHLGGTALFAVTSALMLLWLLVAWRMALPARVHG